MYLSYRYQSYVNVELLICRMSYMVRSPFGALNEFQYFVRDMVKALAAYY